MKKRQKVEKEEEVFADDDAPPVLEAEEGSAFQAEEVVISDEQGTFGDDGTYVLGEEYFVDNGVLYKHAANNQPHQPQQDGKAMEFNFLDSANGGTNICCGLCGEIVPYDLLMNQHLPVFHPEVLSDGIVDLEEIPYEAWLSEKMQNEKMPGGSGGGHGMGYMETRAQISRPIRSTRTLRRISQIRVNINEMSVAELEAALKRKMVEKMGRGVPVTLVDKQHSQCGICGAIISLNKKFEVVHLVRHFNAWHPSEHKCSGTWLSAKDVPMEGTGGKPLSTQDFAFIDTAIDATDNLQCIWCGMSMDANALAMHFHEIHPEEIEVPKCNLCLQELVVNARLTEKYGEDFNVTMPDEHHLKCGKFNTKHTSEAALDKAIAKNLRKIQNGGSANEDNEEDEEEDGMDEDGAGIPRNKKGSASCDTFSNSRMAFGRRSKPKRTFIQPSLRQATPVNSQYVEAVTDCHWRCKICKRDIYAAVISAGAIRHYRAFHADHIQSMQYELCKTRLERVSDGCMEFLHIDLIECLLCRMTFPLHRPFNMCRAIRHLKAKHPSKMPEYKTDNKDEEKPQPKKRGAASGDVDVSRNTLGTSRQATKAAEANENEVVCAEVSDPEVLSMLRDNYGNVEFHKAFSIYGGNVTQQIYMLTNVGEEIDEEVVEQIASQFSGVEPTDEIIVVQYPKENAPESQEQEEYGAEEMEEKMAQKI